MEHADETEDDPDGGKPDSPTEASSSTSHAPAPAPAHEEPSGDENPVKTAELRQAKLNRAELSPTKARRP